MLLRFHRYYVQLSPGKQLLILFVANTFFWLVAWSLYTYWFHLPPKSFNYNILHAMWMSLIITGSTNFKKLKAIFKKQEDGKH